MSFAEVVTSVLDTYVEGLENLTARQNQVHKEGAVDGMLAEYDAVVDEVLSHVESAAVVTVRQQITPTFVAARKQLDKQLDDELAVSTLQAFGKSFVSGCSRSKCQKKVRNPTRSARVEENRDVVVVLSSSYLWKWCPVTVRNCNGIYVETISVAGLVDDGYEVEGFAVNATATLMAIVEYRTSKVTVCALPSGRVVGTFGSRGIGLQQFELPMDFCFSTKHDGEETLLVADSGNHRIAEVSALTGEHERTIPLDSAPCRISANKTMIAICQCWPAEVIVMDAATAQLLQRIFCIDGYFINSVALSADGEIAIAGKDGCFVHFLDGFSGEEDSVGFVFLKANGLLTGACLHQGSELKLSVQGNGVDGFCHRVCFVGNGDIVTCDDKEVFIFTRDGALVHRFEHHVNSPEYFVQLAYAKGRLYVFDRENKCVHVFD
jgi:hypothetical protein